VAGCVVIVTLCSVEIGIAGNYSAILGPTEGST